MLLALVHVQQFDLILNLKALLPVSRVVNALSRIATQHVLSQCVLHCFRANASSYRSPCMYCGPYFSFTFPFFLHILILVCMVVEVCVPQSLTQSVPLFFCD
jgi:hypothetical protein